MKLFIDYLRTKWLTFIACAVFTLIFAGCFVLYKLPLDAILYPALLCVLFGIGFLALDFHRVKKTCAGLRQVLPQQTLPDEGLPETGRVPDKDYRALSLSLQAKNEALRAEDDRRYRDTVEYYSIWAHQIKTPIASMKLRLQNEDSELSRDLSRDLGRVESYVEMAMAFLRLDSESGDYLFREWSLDEILRSAIRKAAPEFIARKLTVDYIPTEKMVLTDEKWLSFVIGQLLQNALQYTKEGGIHIELLPGDRLCISDTGIGISHSDLPRIFEKGYTGENGRIEHTASGIGLYLCQRVCRRLGITLSAESEVGKGTAVYLDLSKKQNRYE